MFKKLLIAAIFSLIAGTATAETLITRIETNGVFFKDQIEVYAIDDPDIKGVVCYVTSVIIRPASLEDPTDSAIACRQIGPIVGTPTDRDSVFANSKNIFFKTQNVKRTYDASRQVLIYTSYVIKAGGKNHAHSISVVPLYQGK